MHLESLFSPKSIAVIGASTKPGTVGNSLTQNLVTSGYGGKVFPVNPKTETLFDLPCYKSIGDIKDEVDLAIIIVPAASVPAVLREVGEKNVPAAIIISSGFKETGAGGLGLENEIIAIAKKYHLALLGPNCLGFLHPKIGLNASFAPRLPLQGSIAFFSQSGALCTALLDLTAGRLGFSHFVSTGNKAVLGENELLSYLAQDEEAKVLGFYTEGLKDAEKIIGTGQALIARAEAKPVIALKSGTTAEGTAASSSHTGALAGSEAAYDALFKQARMVRAESLEDLLNLLTVFSQNPLPAGNTKRLAIITNAGGLGVLATDAASACGLEIAKLSPETESKLKELFPPAASVKNPVDVLGDAPADRYRMALEMCAADSLVDMLLVIVTPQTVTEAKATAEAIADTKNHSEKPIVAVMSGEASLNEGFAVLAQNKVATLRYPEAAATALSKLAMVANWRQAPLHTSFVQNEIDSDAAEEVIQKVRNDNRTVLYETEVWELLEAYGFPFLESAVATSPESASKAATEFNKPVALKIISPDITHKSDVGGVLLDIQPKDAAEAYEKLMAQVKEHAPEARLEGALVVEMADTGGREIILGMKKEPGLGSLIMVGLGGIYVETFKDVAFRFAPLSQEDATEMVNELKSLPLLTGTRGKAGIDMEYLTSSIGRLSQLIVDFPEIEELDINPLLAFPEAQNFRVLDARVRLAVERRAREGRRGED